MISIDWDPALMDPVRSRACRTTLPVVLRFGWRPAPPRKPGQRLCLRSGGPFRLAMPRLFRLASRFWRLFHPPPAGGARGGGRGLAGRGGGGFEFGHPPLRWTVVGGRSSSPLLRATLAHASLPRCTAIYCYRHVHSCASRPPPGVVWRSWLVFYHQSRAGVGDGLFGVRQRSSAL